MGTTEPELGRVFLDRREVGVFGFYELMVAVYRTPISVDVLRSVGAAQKQLFENHGRIAGLTLLWPDALTRPEGPVRDAGQIVSNAFDEMAYASAIVLTESGLQGAFFRSILTGIHMASRRPVPQRVFSNVGEALTWIASKSPESPLAGRGVEIQRRIEKLTKTTGPNAR